MTSSIVKAAWVVIAALSPAGVTPAAADDLALYGGTQFAGATAYGELPCNAGAGLTSFGASGGIDIVTAPLGALALQMRADAAHAFAKEDLTSQCLLPVLTTTEVSHLSAHVGPAVRFRAYGPIVVTIAAQAGAAFIDYDAPVATSDTHLGFQFPVAVDVPLLGGVALSARYRPAALRINGETEVIHMVEGGLRIAF